MPGYARVCCDACPLTQYCTFSTSHKMCNLFHNRRHESIVHFYAIYDVVIYMYICNGVIEEGLMVVVKHFAFYTLQHHTPSEGFCCVCVMFGVCIMLPSLVECLC